MSQDVFFRTDGRGFWSRKKAFVRITNMFLDVYAYDEPEYFGSLNVYFDPLTWNIHNDGLIYTDDQFKKEVMNFLGQHDLPGWNVFYSEQGMQGNDYVNFDVGHAFCAAWMDKFKGMDNWRLIK
jgi:hypothetical protein